MSAPTRSRSSHGLTPVPDQRSGSAAGPAVRSALPSKPAPGSLSSPKATSKIPPLPSTDRAGTFPTIPHVAILSTALKVLLIPAYKSTDFEVHRNWLAVTHSLPVREWYYEKTSEWTLDYPPFFAYFEWLLSQIARFVDPEMLRVDNLNYSSWNTILFQRLSVIFSELVLVYSLHRYVSSSSNQAVAHAAALSVLLSPGLLIIDHIHFQYNGMMYGILILSIVAARKPFSTVAASGSGLLLSGFLFAVLLCFKHIYLYLAPAYVAFLLRNYCLQPNSIFAPAIGHCLALGAVLGTVFAASFGLFVSWGQIPQLLSRLFPFSRGLCHAYWAPNVWALYSFADRLLLSVAPYLGLTVDRSAVNSVTRGLVGNTSFAVLPEITPRTTFVLTIACQLLVLTKLFTRPHNWSMFISAITLCAYASFLFGWHVHEKAILLILIPFSLVPAARDRRYLNAFRPLAIAGHISLFPLLYNAQEMPIKVVYTILWLVVFLISFERLAAPAQTARVFFLDRISGVYTALAVPVILYTCVLHGLLFSGSVGGRSDAGMVSGNGPGGETIAFAPPLAKVLPARIVSLLFQSGRFEFLPLMVTSVYCAFGVLVSWLGFLVVYLSE